MNIIEIKDLEMKYFDKMLYSNVNVLIEEGDVVVVLGENGSGKSTLVKLIAEEETPIKGSIEKNEHTKICVLSQFSPIDEGLTVREVLDIPFKKVIEKANELEQISIKMSEDDTLFDEYLKINEQFEALGGYDYLIEQDKFIKAFDFEKMTERLFSTLSGGEKQYMMLAVSLFDDGDLIILDEPMTFFDKRKAKWLVEFINNSIKTFLIVAHERAFVEKVATKILDIDNKEIKQYDCGYKEYLKQKKQYLEEQLLENNLIDEKLEAKKTQVIKKLNKMEVAIEKHGHAVTIRRLIREIEKLEKQKFDFIESSQYNYTLREKEQKICDIKNNTSDTWIKLTNATVKTDDKLLYEKVNFEFKKDDRIVITGDNGVGKSTFLNVIMNNYEVSEGELYVNEAIDIGYIAQDVFFNDSNLTVFDYCKSVCSLGDIILEEYIDVLFDEDKDIRIKRLYMLSGGESKRLQILANILKGVDLLILDEPTTFMDEYSKSKLRDLLKQFKGGIILVSHDLELIRAVAYDRYRIENNRFNKN